MEQLFTLATVIADSNPQAVINKVGDFILDKKEVQTIYNTSAVMVGAQQFGGGVQAQMQVITTCLIIWRATLEEKNNFEAGQKLKLN